MCVEAARVREDPDPGSADPLRLRPDRRTRPPEGGTEGTHAEERHHGRTETADDAADPPGAGSELSLGQLGCPRRGPRHQIGDAEPGLQQLALLERRELPAREERAVERLPEPVAGPSEVMADGARVEARVDAAEEHLQPRPDDVRDRPAGRLADPSMRDGLEAWLRVGVGLGELRAGPSGYGLRGALARKLTDPRHDAAAALVEEAARLHSVWLLESPARLRAGRRFTLADQDGRLVARSSRLVEPFVCEAIDDVVPRAGPVRLLEIGCGSAVYIRHAAGRNPELTALGLELQPEVAALAAENVSAWGLARRVAIEAGDVMARAAEAAFDLATLHNNIYYFPVEDRMRVLRHVRAFLGPGGRLLLTTLCQGKGVGVDILDRWAATTA